MRAFRILVLPALFCFAITSQAQKVERSVVAAAGNQKAGGTINISQTVGEGVVVLKQAGSLELRQGFQQSAKQDNVGVREVKHLRVTIAPNPFDAELKIFSKEAQPVKYVRVYSVDGRLIMQQAVPNLINAVISTSELAAGHYTVEVVLGNEQVVRQAVIKS